MLPEKLPERRKDPSRQWKEKVLKALRVSPDGLTLLNAVFLVGRRDHDDLNAIKTALDELTVCGRCSCRVVCGKMLYHKID